MMRSKVLTVQKRLLMAGLALTLGACQKTSGDLVVTIDGSSTVFPITKAVAESFEKREPVKVDVKVAMKVTLGISGTGGGFKRFCAREIDVVNASRPIKQSEAELCAKNGVEYVEAPVAYDGLAVAVNPANTWATDITTAELKKAWEPAAQGVVKRWSQVRAGWPDEELHLYGAGTDSGTYDYFAEAIVQDGPALRNDYTASEDDDELVAGVARDRLALGFFGYAYVHKSKGKLKVVAVDDGNAANGDGPIAPSPETVQNGSYQPLSRPLFIYVSTTSLERREVQLFTAYYLTNGAKFSRRVGYVGLPESAYVFAQRRVSARKTGSLFAAGDAQVGVSIEQLMKKEHAAPRVARSPSEQP
jgi:phosphate transport system substrate-binding protein